MTFAISSASRPLRNCRCLFALLATLSISFCATFSAAEQKVVEDGGTGPFKAIATRDDSLPGITIFRPADLDSVESSSSLPIVLWGNGACANTTFEHKNFLNEIASHGYAIFAIGLFEAMEERGEAFQQKTNSSQLLEAMDWAIAENDRPESLFYGKLDTNRIAAMGMSCGGLQVIEIAADARLTTVVICNSGVLKTASPFPGMPTLTKDVLDTFHTPVLYLMGGPSDIAFDNAMDDFERVNHVPIVMTNLDVGHGGTYMEPHGGAYSGVALAWLDWQLKGEKDSSKMFLGEESTLAQDPDWTIESKNFD